jgi:hypothetical protein
MDTDWVFFKDLPVYDLYSIKINLAILYTDKCFQGIEALNYEYSLKCAPPGFLISSCKYRKLK